MSHVKWLQAGDSNSRFFHQTILQRKRSNRVDKLQNGNGTWIEDDVGIHRTVDLHFSNLFNIAGYRDWGSILDCIDSVVTDEMNASLSRSFSLEEIKDAVFNMGGLKAPSLNGFQGVFFQSFWDFIVEEVNGLDSDFVNGNQPEVHKFNTNYPYPEGT